MLVRDILRTKGTDVVTVSPDVTVHEAMRVLVRYNIGSLIVRDGSIRGIITERDMLRAGAEDLQWLATARVGELMSTNLITAPPDAEIHHVMDLMTEHRVRHLPIVERGALCGMISIGDVVNALRHCVEAENHSLHAYITGTPL